jgi:hypothetical protein
LVEPLARAVAPDEFVCAKTDRLNRRNKAEAVDLTNASFRRARRPKDTFISLDSFSAGSGVPVARSQQTVPHISADKPGFSGPELLQAVKQTAKGKK